MSTYSVGKGRKKAVNKFRTRDGLRMVLIIVVALVAMILLWMLGILRFDAD